ncbi:hypothetical protein MB901379_01435 [Mycobacterium basiliense]|uniref:Uncharacterized protein n=1 Tax=Mycobacterium basiliense TaxID=2094119 RepID=A0A3S4BUD6_9MYCO|nr:hypothetical protein MB901379_01435 [Mycobacterium basiliense]
MAKTKTFRLVAAALFAACALFAVGCSSEVNEPPAPTMTSSFPR